MIMRYSSVQQIMSQDDWIYLMVGKDIVAIALFFKLHTVKNIET